jgi:hypothetical protein
VHKGCTCQEIFRLHKNQNLKEFLEEVVLGSGKSLWTKFFGKPESYFNKRLGLDWKQRDKFFKEFEESLRHSGKANR